MSIFDEARKSIQNLGNPQVHPILAKFTQAGQSLVPALTTAGKGTADLFVKKPFEFGQQMGNDLVDLAGVGKTWATTGVAPVFEMPKMNSVKVNNVKNQVKRGAEIMGGVYGAKVPAQVAGVAGLKGGMDYLINKNPQQAINTAISTLPQSIVQAGWFSKIPSGVTGNKYRATGKFATPLKSFLTGLTK